LLLARIFDAPSGDDGTAARGFYRRGVAAGLAGKTGPFSLMTAADLFFYRGWRFARRQSKAEFTLKFGVSPA
jgi:hypothetical protein